MPDVPKGLQYPPTSLDGFFLCEPTSCICQVLKRMLDIASEVGYSLAPEKILDNPKQQLPHGGTDWVTGKIYPKFLAATLPESGTKG